MELLQNIRPLTQEERDTARENAQRAIVGNAPDRARFVHTAQHKHPPYVRVGMTAFCAVLLVVAFLPSAMRLHHIGAQTFLHTINDFWSAEVAGWSMVLLAEIGQLVFTVALATLDANRSQRYIMIGCASLCTAVALVGNIQIARPMMQEEMFAWLEATVPPIMVLGTASILKQQILKSIELRYTTEQEYQTALDAWKGHAQLPERDASWSQKYANALRDAIRKANARSTAGKQALLQLQRGDWFALVQREMQADAWFSSASEVEHEVQAQRVQKLQHLELHNAQLQDAITRLQSERSSNGHTGNHTGEIAIARDGAMHSATCPHCGYEVTHKASRRAASNALAAHLRGCKSRPEMQTKVGA